MEYVNRKASLGGGSSFNHSSARTIYIQDMKLVATDPIVVLLPDGARPRLYMRVFWQYWWKNHVIYIDLGKWWVGDFTHGNVCPVAFKKLAVPDAKPKMIAHKLFACYTSSLTIWSWVHCNLEIYMCKVEKHIEV